MSKPPLPLVCVCKSHWPACYIKCIVDSFICVCSYSVCYSVYLHVVKIIIIYYFIITILLLPQKLLIIIMLLLLLLLLLLLMHRQ